MKNTYPNRCEEVLAHHGVKGMHWGVRRYQNPDGSLTAKGKARLEKQTNEINKMYDKMNTKSMKKANKLDKKGKTAKANVQREMVKYNNEARKRNLNSLNTMNAKQYKKARRRSNIDTILGFNNLREAGSKAMNTPLTRLNERYTQFGMRWISNFTFNSTLAQMTPEEGMKYLRNKGIAAMYSSNT